MAAITQYILSIIGIVFLGVLVDVVLPDGEMNKFIKGMFALIAVFVIVSPISKLVNTDITVEKLADTSIQIEVDNDFLSATTNQYINSLQNILKAKLTDSGYENINVTINGYLSNNVLVIEKVKIDISNMVLTKEKQHINKYTEITKIAVESLNVEESDVFIDEWKKRKKWHLIFGQATFYKQIKTSKTHWTYSCCDICFDIAIYNVW